MKKRALRAGFFALLAGPLLLSAAACSPTVATRGNLISDTKFPAVKAQESRRADVVAAWGPPTTVSSFDPNTWYYIGETTSQRGIFAPEVEKRRLVRVRFNPDDGETVAAVDDLDPKQAQDIDFAARRTPTAGKEFTAIQQFVGNLGKYNSSAANKQGQ